MQRLIFGFTVLLVLFFNAYSKSVDDNRIRKIREEENDPIAIGECTSNKQCAAPFTSCRQGSCLCIESYVQDGSGKCVKAPTVGEKCALDDGTILDCNGPGVDATCPADGPNKNKCFCIAGYEQVGKVCKFKDQNLNEKCSSDADCGVAFSTCQGGKCACIAGFKANAGKGICASDPKCPSGDPPKGSDGKVKTCDVNKDRLTDGKGDKESVVDSCPADQFCFHHPLSRTSSGLFSGHCCPKVKQDSAAGNKSAVCPLGDALKVDVCDSDVDSTSSDDGPSEVAPPSAGGTSSSCPWLTHTCVYAANASSAACCPSPCAAQLSAFAANGRCYATLAPGDACKFDVQCGRSASCQQPADKGNSVCTCKSDYTLNNGVCEKSSDQN